MLIAIWFDLHRSKVTIEQSWKEYPNIYICWMKSHCPFPLVTWMVLLCQLLSLPKQAHLAFVFHVRPGAGDR